MQGERGEMMWEGRVDVLDEIRQSDIRAFPFDDIDIFATTSRLSALLVALLSFTAFLSFTERDDLC